jgi:hypothetical protein
MWLKIVLLRNNVIKINKFAKINTNIKNTKKMITYMYG